MPEITGMTFRVEILEILQQQKYDARFGAYFPPRPTAQGYPTNPASGSVSVSWCDESVHPPEDQIKYRGEGSKDKMGMGTGRSPLAYLAVPPPPVRSLGKPSKPGYYSFDSSMVVHIFNRHFNSQRLYLTY